MAITILCLSTSGSSAATFTRDIAPVLYKRCSPCHHDRQSAPFSLVTYSDVIKHAKQIAEAVNSGLMPPWLPDPNPSGFLNDRSLSASEKALILSWISEGTPEGDPAILPKAPQWPQGWLLGKPDLVLTMPKPFLLGPDGGDVYRNFVIPSGLSSNVNIRAVEFHAGNPKVMHHSFIKVDETHKSAILESMGNGVGFEGMNSGAKMPTGQFLTWQPGKLPVSTGPVWTLSKNSDLVFETHMHRSGKPETVSSSIGLYFTQKSASTNFVKILLGSLALNILAGDTNYVVEDSFVLPTDCDVSSVLPHAHYLCTEMKAWAELPTGTPKQILIIRHWDFNWQGDYQYAAPIPLPKGTKLKIRYTYDNSTNNLKNPNNPPKNVYYGTQSSDEMCEFWIQLVVRDSAHRIAIETAFQQKSKDLLEKSILSKLTRNPGDSQSLSDLGLLRIGDGKYAEAEKLFQRAIQANPDDDTSHYRLGLVYRITNRYSDSDAELLRAVSLNPRNAPAWGNLGYVKAGLGDAEGAKTAFRQALDIDPTDVYAKAALKELEALPKKP